jgi:hypothetical protein
LNSVGDRISNGQQQRGVVKDIQAIRIMTQRWGCVSALLVTSYVRVLRAVLCCCGSWAVARVPAAEHPFDVLEDA